MAMTTRRFKFRFRRASAVCALAALAASALPLAARADAIYLCVSADGRRELTDTHRAGCKEISVPGAIAAPPARRGPARDGAAPRTASAAPATTPADFPKVDTALQKSRDSDRREILNDELRAEERKLAAQRTEFNNGEPERQGNERNFAKYQERVAQLRDNIARTEKNIVALRREIAAIK